MKTLALIASALALTGCTSDSHLGTINGVEFRTLSRTDPLGVNIVQIIRIDPDGTVSEGASASSGGLAPSLIGATGNIVAAGEIRPDRTTTNTNTYVNTKKRPPLTARP
jgi:hypothetical protein